MRYIIDIITTSAMLRVGCTFLSLGYRHGGIEKEQRWHPYYDLEKYEF
jgi:hypothetical protein